MLLQITREVSRVHTSLSMREMCCCALSWKDIFAVVDGGCKGKCRVQFAIFDGGINGAGRWSSFNVDGKFCGCFVRKELR